ncbi:MAG TPA: hypothetical protein VKH19_11310 [Gemmatimonadaceae bacterium]|nr:hypothetical protein [Gemmatimonadaceae bacterium]
MNANLRDRILRKLDALPDDRGYQVLDYIEFLESKYAERQNPANAFTRFTEAVEDRLRAGKVSASAIAETMGLLNRAGNVLSGAMAAGRSVANDIVTAAQSVTTTRGAPVPPGSAAAAGTTAAPGTAGPAAPTAAGPSNSGIPSEASSPAHDVKEPGSGEERL